MSMSKDEQKRKRLDLTYTQESLPKRKKSNDAYSSDGENGDIYVTHVFNELSQSKSSSTTEMISNITTTQSPVSRQLDVEESIEPLKQRVIEINKEKLKILEIQRQLIELLTQMNESEMRKSNTLLLYKTKSMFYSLILEELTIQKRIEEIQQQNEFTRFPFARQSKSVTIPPPIRIVQQNTDEINDASEKVTFNREEYMELYEKLHPLFNKKVSDKAGALMTYPEPAAPQLKLYYLTGEMVPNGAIIQKIKRQTFCNGKQVITGRALIAGKIYFYLDRDPLKTDQLLATELIPPHAVPVKTAGSPYSTYKGREVVQLCLTSVKEKPGKIIRKRSPDYSAHYAFHTKAINTINNTTINFNSRSSSTPLVLLPLVTNSLNEEKGDQNFSPLPGIQNTGSIPSDFDMLTTANNESSSPRPQERKNESHNVAFLQPQIIINPIIMVQENETPSLLPGFNHLLSSLSIFSSGNNSTRSSVSSEEKEKKESNLNF